MISMTAFGSAQVDENEVSVGLRIRSVNHKYLDIRTNLPSDMVEIEHKVLKLLKESLNRGRVDLNFNISLPHKDSGTLSINKDLIGQYFSAAKEICKENEAEFSHNIWDLFRLEKVSELKSSPRTDIIEENCLNALKIALKKLSEMKEIEGNFIKEKLTEYVNSLEELLEIFKSEADQHKSSILERLKKNLEFSGEKVNIDPVRIDQEIVFHLNKLDIEEEITRLESHFKQFHTALEKTGMIGKKLDFLSQEIFRELNTIAAKSERIPISNAVVEGKFKVAQIREQLPNIE